MIEELKKGPVAEANGQVREPVDAGLSGSARARPDRAGSPETEVRASKIR